MLCWCNTHLFPPRVLLCYSQYLDLSSPRKVHCQLVTELEHHLHLLIDDQCKLYNIYMYLGFTYHLLLSPLHFHQSLPWYCWRLLLCQAELLELMLACDPECCPVL